MLINPFVLDAPFLYPQGGENGCTGNEWVNLFNIGLSSSKKVGFICFNESPLKMMKNNFYFSLEALFVIKIFKLS